MNASKATAGQTRLAFVFTMARRHGSKPRAPNQEEGWRKPIVDAHLPRVQG